MKIVGLMATHGRHYYCERAVGMFLAQHYDNKHLIILQNSSIAQKLDKPYNNITLVNDDSGGSLGDVYNKMLDYLPVDADLICIFDDDDVFLPNHFTEGEQGYLRGNKKAYKPKYSFFWCNDDIVKTNNVLETSWFVNAEIIKKYRFRSESKLHHFNWVDWLTASQEVFVDGTGPSTMACTWGVHEKPLYHSSGDPTSNNFENFRKHELDHGDQIITPWSIEKLSAVYAKFNNSN
jgi:hypothetical protein